MEWVPTNIRGASVRDPSTGLVNSEGMVDRFTIFEDMNTIDTTNATDNQVQSYDSFRQYNPIKTVMIERDNRLLAKQMNAPWAQADLAVTDNGLPKASIGLTIGYRGVEPQTTIGRIRLTYFVTFRG